ncbi:TetR/AcrR family transcriptional regulator [Variovorax sp. J22R115]|uniref:TetR/AcrR family transcriptional regulator n=1 Tax=Variovorax sp. J22R115 TaxID=3053509 RepID=UPI002575E012|nr:TetR/AcrR family transcriptional regulator [Variovorax sp. J22R115]MDM0047775.1 helix-turn-helix domain-containing protein [Variovorax sp. J22R115]
MKAQDKRPYRSETRSEAAERTRARILDAGKFLFSRKGIDATTIAQIAERARVSEPTVYAVVKSKAGLLHALMHDAIFGPRFKEAHQKLEGLSDPVQRIVMSAHVARAIYEGESAELGLLMKSAAFSPELRKTNQSFEALRREMQRERIDALFAAKRARKGLTKEAAATVLWMLTSREVYHKLVHESGWAPDVFQAWLEQALLEALTDGLGSDCDA